MSRCCQLVHVDQRGGRRRKPRSGPRGPEHRKSTSGRHRTRPPGEVRRSGLSKKGRLVRADQPHLFVRLAFWSTWTSAGVAAEKCVLVRADQDAGFWKGARRNLPSGVPCGEGRIEAGATGRIEGRAALVPPRNSCPGPATLHLACTPTNGVPSARPLSPNHWGEGRGVGQLSPKEKRKWWVAGPGRGSGESRETIDRAGKGGGGEFGGGNRNRGRAVNRRDR